MRLAEGRYLGDVCGISEVNGIVITETTHPPLVTLPTHSHANAYLCYVTAGTFTEVVGASTRTCRLHIMVYHPPEELHSERIHDAGASSVNIELTQSFLASLDMPQRMKHESFASNRHALHGLVTKLRYEMRLQDSLSQLAVESIACGIVVEAFRAHLRDHPTPFG